MKHRLAFALVALAAAVGAAVRPPPTPQAVEPAADARLRMDAWADGPLRWNAIAADLIDDAGLSPPRAARAFAAVSEASRLAWAAEQAFPTPGGVAGGIAASHLAAGAGARIALATLAPESETRLAGLLTEQRAAAAARGLSATQIAGAVRRGEAAAAPALAHVVADGGARSPRSGPARAGDWQSRDGEPGLDPDWGAVAPWVAANAAIVIPPPPAPGSPAWQAALDELRATSAALTDAQVRVAVRWAGGASGGVPPLLWNRIARDALAADGIAPGPALEILSLMHRAMADVGIVVWRAKYAYGGMRPWQADPTIAMPVLVPPFPSYPSGHSAFSWAAARVLGACLPARAAEFDALAGEASLSRLYGGLHWRFDLDAGQAAGEAAAAAVLADRGCPTAIIRPS